MNTWPGGIKRAMTQSEHEAWNDENYPGTRQICYKCDEPTGRCEEDGIFDDDTGEPYCYDCAIGAGIIESDQAN